MEVESVSLDEVSSPDLGSAVTDSDASDLYDDLDPTTTTHNSNNDDSANSDMDDAGIFLELGMPLDNNAALATSTTTTAEQAAPEKTGKLTCSPSCLNGGTSSSSSTSNNTSNDVCASDDDDSNNNNEDDNSDNNDDNGKARAGIQSFPVGSSNVGFASLHTEDREVEIDTGSNKVNACQTRTTALAANSNTSTETETQCNELISKDKEKNAIKSSNVDVNFILSYLTKHQKTISGKKIQSVKESDAYKRNSPMMRKKRNSSRKSGNCESEGEMDGKDLLLTSTTNDKKLCDRDNWPKESPDEERRSHGSVAGEAGIIGVMSGPGNSGVTCEKSNSGVTCEPSKSGVICKTSRDGVTSIPNIGITGVICEPSSSGVTNKLNSDGVMCKPNTTDVTVKPNTSGERCEPGTSSTACKPSSGGNDSNMSKPTTNNTVGMIMQMISVPRRSRASDFMNTVSDDDKKETGTADETRTRTKKSKKSKAEDQAGQDMDMFEDILLGQDRGELVQEINRLKLEKKQMAHKLETIEQRCAGLEKDNTTLLSNMSALWKTASAQLREKSNAISTLTREKEAIIFRRVLRQVPKDELDRVVSRITAYDKQEFASFLDSLNKEEKMCSCGGAAASTTGASRTKSVTRRVRESVRGERVVLSSDSEVHSLTTVLGKKSEKITFEKERHLKNVRTPGQEDRKKRSDLRNSPHDYNNFRDSSRGESLVTPHSAEKSKKKSVFSRLGLRTSQRLQRVDNDAKDDHSGKENCQPSRDEMYSVAFSQRSCESVGSALATRIHNIDKELIDEHRQQSTGRDVDRAMESKGDEDDSAHTQANGSHDAFVKDGDKPSNSKGTEDDSSMHKRSRQHTGESGRTKESKNEEEDLKLSISSRQEACTVSIPINDTCAVASERSRVENVMITKGGDDVDDDEEMLSKSLYGQRMLARMRNRISGKKPSLALAASTAASSPLSTSTKKTTETLRQTTPMSPSCITTPPPSSISVRTTSTFKSTKMEDTKSGKENTKDIGSNRGSGSGEQVYNKDRGALESSPGVPNRMKIRSTQLEKEEDKSLKIILAPAVTTHDSISVSKQAVNDTSNSNNRQSSSFDTLIPSKGNGNKVTEHVTARKETEEQSNTVNSVMNKARKSRQATKKELLSIAEKDRAELAEGKHELKQRLSTDMEGEASKGRKISRAENKSLHNTKLLKDANPVNEEKGIESLERTEIQTRSRARTSPRKKDKAITGAKSHEDRASAVKDSGGGETREQRRESHSSDGKDSEMSVDEEEARSNAQDNKKFDSKQDREIRKDNFTSGKQGRLRKDSQDLSPLILTDSVRKNKLMSDEQERLRRDSQDMSPLLLTESDTLSEADQYTDGVDVSGHVNRRLNFRPKSGAVVSPLEKQTAVKATKNTTEGETLQQMKVCDTEGEEKSETGEHNEYEGDSEGDDDDDKNKESVSRGSYEESGVKRGVRRRRNRKTRKCKLRIIYSDDDSDLNSDLQDSAKETLNKKLCERKDLIMSDSGEISLLGELREKSVELRRKVQARKGKINLSPIKDHELATRSLGIRTERRERERKERNGSTKHQTIVDEGQYSQQEKSGSDCSDGLVGSLDPVMSSATKHGGSEKKITRVTNTRIPDTKCADVKVSTEKSVMQLEHTNSTTPTAACMEHKGMPIRSEKRGGDPQKRATKSSSKSRSKSQSRESLALSDEVKPTCSVFINDDGRNTVVSVNAGNRRESDLKVLSDSVVNDADSEKLIHKNNDVKGHAARDRTRHEDEDEDDDDGNENIDVLECNLRSEDITDLLSTSQDDDTVPITPTRPSCPQSSPARQCKAVVSSDALETTRKSEDHLSDKKNNGDVHSEPRKTSDDPSEGSINLLDSLLGPDYTEDSMFPQEEELLYDEGSEDSDESQCKRESVPLTGIFTEGVLKDKQLEIESPIVSSSKNCETPKENNSGNRSDKEDSVIEKCTRRSNASPIKKFSVVAQTHSPGRQPQGSPLSGRTKDHFLTREGKDPSSRGGDQGTSPTVRQGENPEFKRIPKLKTVKSNLRGVSKHGVSPLECSNYKQSRSLLPHQKPAEVESQSSKSNDDNKARNVKSRLKKPGGENKLPRQSKVKSDSPKEVKDRDSGLRRREGREDTGDPASKNRDRKDGGKKLPDKRIAKDNYEESSSRRRRRRDDSEDELPNKKQRLPVKSRLSRPSVDYKKASPPRKWHQVSPDMERRLGDATEDRTYTGSSLTGRSIDEDKVTPSKIPVDNNLLKSLLALSPTKSVTGEDEKEEGELDDDEEEEEIKETKQEQAKITNRDEAEIHKKNDKNSHTKMIAENPEETDTKNNFKDIEEKNHTRIATSTFSKSEQRKPGSKKDPSHRGADEQRVKQELHHTARPKRTRSDCSGSDRALHSPAGGGQKNVRERKSRSERNKTNRNAADIDSVETAQRPMVGEQAAKASTEDHLKKKQVDYQVTSDTPQTTDSEKSPTDDWQKGKTSSSTNEKFSAISELQPGCQDNTLAHGTRFSPQSQPEGCDALKEGKMNTRRKTRKAQASVLRSPLSEKERFHREKTSPVVESKQGETIVPAKECLPSKQELKKKSLQSQMFDDNTTFFPTSLFQVVSQMDRPAKAAADRHNTASSASTSVLNDTIDQILKEHNNNFVDSGGSDDSETSLLRFISALNSEGTVGEEEEEEVAREEGNICENLERVSAEGSKVQKDVDLEEGDCVVEHHDKQREGSRSEPGVEITVDGGRLATSEQNIVVALSQNASSSAPQDEFTRSQDIKKRNSSNRPSSTSFKDESHLQINSRGKVESDESKGESGGRLSGTDRTSTRMTRKYSNHETSQSPVDTSDEDAAADGTRIQVGDTCTLQHTDCDDIGKGVTRSVHNSRYQECESNDGETLTTLGLECSSSSSDSEGGGGARDSNVRGSSLSPSPSEPVCEEPPAISQSPDPSGQQPTEALPSNVNDSSSSSSDSDSDSDCRCSDCVNKNSSSSSSSSDSSSDHSVTLGSDTDSEGSVSVMCGGVKHQPEEKLGSQDTIEASGRDSSRCRASSPLLFVPSLTPEPDNGGHISEITSKSIQNTPRKSPQKDDKMPCKFKKSPRRTPGKKTPCKKTPKKTPCTKTPSKTPCKKTPKSKSEKNPGTSVPTSQTESPVGKSERADATVIAVYQSPKSSEVERVQSPGVCEVERKQITGAGAAPGRNQTSSKAGDVEEDPEVLSPIMAALPKVNTNITLEDRLARSDTAPQGKQLLFDSHDTKTRTLSSSKSDSAGEGNEVIKVVGAKDKVIFMKQKTSPSPETSQLQSFPLIETVIKRSKRLHSFNPDPAVSSTLSCASTSTVISMVHENRRKVRAQPPSRTHKKGVIRSIKKEVTEGVVEGGHLTVKTRTAGARKRQLSPDSNVSDTRNAVGKKPRMMSPHVSGKALKGEGRKPQHFNPDPNKLQPLVPVVKTGMLVPVKIRRVRRQLNLGCVDPVPLGVPPITPIKGSKGGTGSPGSPGPRRSPRKKVQNNLECLH